MQRGGIDENGYSKRMYAGNQLLYAIVASNYDRLLTYRQAVRLVKLDDVERIIAFIIKNLPEQKESRTEELTLHRM